MGNNRFIAALGVTFITTTVFIQLFAQSAFRAQKVFAPRKEVLNLTFAGDIMAHKQVTSMPDFSLIYKDIEPLLQSDDLTFANLEAPIVNGRDYTSYPRFSVKEDFPLAAVLAGVDVFALANNHINDYGAQGVKDTFDFCASRPIFCAGIKQSLLETVSHTVIDVKGWKILFVSVADFTNRADAGGYVDLISRAPARREIFINTLKELRQKNPADIFVLAYHIFAPEYELSPQKETKEFFRTLADGADIDVLWGLHPHTAQGYEIKTGGGKDKVIIYSLGSLISAQRGKPDYKNPSQISQYSGDGFLLQLSYINTDGGHALAAVNPVIITIDRDKDGHRAIRPLVRNFTGGEDKKLDAYYNERLELMQKITGGFKSYIKGDANSNRAVSFKLVK